MITCELCPRAFHSKCLGIVPASEDWVCPECEVSANVLMSGTGRFKRKYCNVIKPDFFLFHRH